MIELQEIKPIINGSVNPRLTPELFNQIQDISTKRQVVWNLLVSMEFCHSYRDVEPKIFEKPNIKSLFLNPEIFDHTHVFQADDEALNNLFVVVKEVFRKHHNEMRIKTADLRHNLGMEIYQVQSKLGFGGWLEMDKDRLMGYVDACGSWNDFRHKDIKGAILQMDKMCPRMEYGANNPNTGGIMHKWKSVRGCEYITMEFEFVDSKTLEAIKEFYRTKWEPKGREISADSIRNEVVDHGGGFFGIELIWWWD